LEKATQLYTQLLALLKQHSRYSDVRHIHTLALMVQGLLSSQRLNLTAWEPCVKSRAKQAQSYQRRFSRFVDIDRIQTSEIYLPLVLNALSLSKSARVYLALDTSMLWNEFCLISASIVTCGRAVPLVWRVIKHESASVAFGQYQPLLVQAQKALKDFGDVMLLADRAFASHDLMQWLRPTSWHWCLRVKCDVQIHGPHAIPVVVEKLFPSSGEATFYRQVGLWEDGRERVDLALANLPTAEESWAVITDEIPTLKTFEHYGKRFDTEELYLDSKSGAFQLEDSRLDEAEHLERLYLVAAVAILFSTLQGMSVQFAGLRRQVDPHWKRGLSYLKIGLNWIHGVLHKGRDLLDLVPLFRVDPQPCFASKEAKRRNDERFEFSKARTRPCKYQTVSTATS
jgi:hypothetical protein